jgi:hypothetical protein
MADDTNDLERLIKIMGMTGSDNENQALVAVRKANELVAKLGGWTAILRGKVQIRIIADPFAGVQMPSTRPSSRPVPPPPAPSRPRPDSNDIDAFVRSRTTRPAPQTPSRPQPAPRADINNIFGSTPASGNVSAQRLRERPNQYAGTCISCKNEVAALDGLCFQRQSGGRWYTEHKPGTCPPPRKKRAAFTSDDLQI